MIANCKYCDAKVNIEHVADYVDASEEGVWRYTFGKCPVCSAPFLMIQGNYGGDDDWEAPDQLYPDINMALGAAVPSDLRKVFDEARKCLRAGAYTASNMMCRKAMEGLVWVKEVKRPNLLQGLAKLRDDRVIDDRLYRWANLLRIVGNDAAHDIQVSATKQDAVDALAFTAALLEYVFTFEQRFEQFQARRAKADDKRVGATTRARPKPALAVPVKE